MLSQDERNHAVRGDAYTEENSVTEEIQGEISTETVQPERRYLVAAYHHFENGVTFYDKLDYYTLEKWKPAQGYVDGTMEDDGFKYDGAAVYDQQEHKCIRIYGDYPDEGTRTGLWHCRTGTALNISLTISMWQRTSRSVVRWTLSNTVPLKMP